MLLFYSSSTHAQQVLLSIPDPSATPVLQKALAALAGSFPVNDVTLTGTARRIVGSADETGTVIAKALGSAGQSRIDYEFPSGPRSEIRNPLNSAQTPSAPLTVPAHSSLLMSHAGAWSGPDGVTHVEPDHNLLTDSTWFFPALTIGRIASSPAYVVQEVADETGLAAAVIHLHVSKMPAAATPSYLVTIMQRLSTMDIFLNQSTLLPTILSFNIHPTGNALIDIPVEIHFSDYNSVDGVMIPLHVQRFENGSLVLDLQFQNTIVNSGIAPGVFQIQ